MLKTAEPTIINATHFCAASEAPTTPAGISTMNAIGIGIGIMLIILNIAPQIAPQIVPAVQQALHALPATLAMAPGALLGLIRPASAPIMSAPAAEPEPEPPAPAEIFEYFMLKNGIPTNTDDHIDAILVDDTPLHIMAWEQICDIHWDAAEKHDNLTFLSRVCPSSFRGEGAVGGGGVYVPGIELGSYLGHGARYINRWSEWQEDRGAPSVSAGFSAVYPAVGAERFDWRWLMPPAAGRADDVSALRLEIDVPALALHSRGCFADVVGDRIFRGSPALFRPWSWSYELWPLVTCLPVRVTAQARAAGAESPSAILEFAARNNMLWPFRPTAKFCGRAIDLNLQDRLGRSGPGELNEMAYKFGMPNHTIEQWSIVDNPQYQDAYCAVIQAMAEITTTARQRADEDFPLGDEGEYVLPTEQQAAAGLGRIVVREPAVGSAYMRLSLAVRRWRIGVSGKGPRARYHRQHTGRRIGRGQRQRMRRMRMMMMEEEGGTGGPTTTALEEDGAGDDGGDGGGPDPAVEGGEMRRDLGRAEIQAGTGSEDEGMSSDGERGGEEYYDEYFEGIGADAALEDGEFGGGPWSGEDPYAYGGAD